MTTILVDMDGVIADWGTAYGEALDEFGNRAKNIPRHHNQQSFNLTAGLTDSEANIVNLAMTYMDYAGLNPIEGAIDALRSMADFGYDVVICTSPWLPNPTCVQDKVDWVRHHLGTGWAERTIITKDKTMVRGDYLIDDKPKITGRFEPSWEQIVFTQPYNVGVLDKFRIDSWDNWKNEDWA